MSKNEHNSISLRALGLFGLLLTLEISISSRCTHTISKNGSRAPLVTDRTAS